MKETVKELEQAILPLVDEYTEVSFKEFEDLRNWLIEQVTDLKVENQQLREALERETGRHQAGPSMHYR